MDEETEQISLRLPSMLLRHIEGVAASKKWTVSRTIRAILRRDYTRDHALAENKGYEEMVARERYEAAKAAFADELPNE